MARRGSVAALRRGWLWSGWRGQAMGPVTACWTACGMGPPYVGKHCNTAAVAPATVAPTTTNPPGPAGGT